MLRVSYGVATISVMVTKIAQRELRNNNAEILNRVEDGESFVVSRNGVAVADVTPHVEHGGPPLFPKTGDLMARRREARRQGGGPLMPDMAAWLLDIRESGVVDDDPLNSRA